MCEQVEEGWWSGSLSGRSGLFPSNFVKELEDEETSEVAVATDETGETHTHTHLNTDQVRDTRDEARLA